MPETGHKIASYLRIDLPSVISNSLGAHQRGFICTGSAGAGNWAAVPWVAVFDPRVTDTATKGYYVVYLFSPDDRRLYLSLNQGTTAVIDEFGSQGYALLKDRASLMRTRLPEFLDQFPL